MEKLGKLIFRIPEGSDNYHYAAPDVVLMLPLGTRVLVENHGRTRPYVIVRWGKHHLKRLKWVGKEDYNLFLDADEYLPIRATGKLKYKINRGKKK